MRFRNLLGLLAIGGAVAYAQKKRGGELSIEGFKKSLRGAVDNVKGKLDSISGNANGGTTRRSSDMGTSDVESSSRSSIADDYASSSGYSPRTYGSTGIDGANKKL